MGVTRQPWGCSHLEGDLGWAPKGSVGENAPRREALTGTTPPIEGVGPQLSQWARTLEDQIPSVLTACPQLGRGPGHHEIESGGSYPPLTAPGFLGRDHPPSGSWGWLWSRSKAVPVW